MACKSNLSITQKSYIVREKIPQKAFENMHYNLLRKQHHHAFFPLIARCYSTHPHKYKANKFASLSFYFYHFPTQKADYLMVGTALTQAMTFVFAYVSDETTFRYIHISRNNLHHRHDYCISNTFRSLSNVVSSVQLIVILTVT